jgi:hypothetical protein
MATILVSISNHTAIQAAQQQRMPGLYCRTRKNALPFA